MSVRQSLFAAASALAAAAFAVPAHAQPGDVVRDYAGYVTSGSGEALDAGPQVTGVCQYTRQPTVGGSGMKYAFSGTAVATATLYSYASTFITCTLVSPARGLPGEQPTLTARVEARCSGVTCSTAVAGVSDWPVRPVMICVSGSAWFMFPSAAVTSVEIRAACAP